MTCKEFQLQFEDYGCSGTGEVSEHVRECADCRRVFNEQEELRRHLQLVRQSAPLISESLDATVLSSYRNHKATITNRSEQRREGIVPLIWSRKTGVAAMALVLVIVVFVARRNGSQPNRNGKTVTVLPKVQTTPTPQITNAPVTVSSKHHTNNSYVVRAKSKPKTSPPSTVVASLPEGFRSLMYCDALSCPDTMEMIRVQLPPAFMDFTSASNSSGAVYADVLVGSDGIARGIRVVQ